MATPLPSSPSITISSLYSCKLFLFPSPVFLPYSSISHTHKSHCLGISASSSLDKPRRGRRKVKSDAELCSEIREFLSLVGFAEDHVPSMKELSQNGRQDLANIVRRRGYKYIKQLLETSIPTDIDTGQNENLEVQSGSGGQDEKLKVLANEPLSSESIEEGLLQDSIKTDVQLSLNDQSSFVSEPSTLSLQEKVANFVQYGELDAVEDSGFGISYQRHADREESKIDSEDINESEFSNEYHEHKDHLLHGFIGAETLNGNALSSVQFVEDPPLDDNLSRDSFLSTEEITSADHVSDSEFEKMENEAEVKRLKFLLHRKELELTQLKEQIEKEKLALSALQTKAETEISKAQKLISQKEMDLHAAEESLSGLKEVEIEYSGEGDNVELAGSFNGWHHKIKMELVQSSSITDPPESRTSRLWRAALWLYPGVYEIKFVIDGHWRIDPQRESVTRDNVHNNILRVDR